MKIENFENNIKIEKFENDIQTLIITYCIYNDTFCKEILNIININKELFTEAFTDTIRKIIYLIIQYYKLYLKAPKNDIFNVFEEQKNKYKEEDQELIKKILEQIKPNNDLLNIKYLIDKAKHYLREVNVNILQKKISNLKKIGKLDEVEKLITNFNSIKKDTEALEKTDLLNEIYEDNNIYEKLFSLNGFIGEIMGNFHRSDLIAVLSPAKRGKTFFLIEIAINAMLNNLNVVYFNLEMSHKKILQRFYQNLTGEIKTLQENIEYQLINIPKFIQENDKYRIEMTQQKKYGLNSELVKNKLYSIKTIVNGNIKVLSYPPNLCTVNKISYILDEFVKDNFIPDVLIVDYADILTSHKKQSEYRHSLNDIWLSLRSLALEKHICIFTASHTNKQTFEKNIKQSDISEESRKLNHATLMIALNQTKEEKLNNMMRVNTIINRDDEFHIDKTALILQQLAISKSILDSIDYDLLIKN